MTIEELMLRDYRQDDLDAMVALDRVCFERPFRFSRAAMRSFAEAGNAYVSVAERDGQMAGFCILHVEETEDGRVGYIVTLDVAPEYRRMGLGRAFMRHMQRQSSAKTCFAMALHVYTCNVEAVRFYERDGFVFSHTIREFYGAGLDAQVWRKALLAIK